MSRRVNMSTSQMFRPQLSYSTFFSPGRLRFNRSPANHQSGPTAEGARKLTKRRIQRPQRGGRSATAVWVSTETADGLRLPLQPTTSNSGALFTFAHHPKLPSRGTGALACFSPLWPDLDQPVALFEYSRRLIR